MTTEAEKALKKAQREATKLRHQKMLTLHMQAAGLPLPIFEKKFHPTRGWKADAIWPDYKLVVEIEGGIYQKQGGGHRSVSGFESNLEKYNELSIEGWFLIRVLPEWLNQNRNEARLLIQRFFDNYITSTALPL